MRAQFKEIELSVYLSEANLPYIIPMLNSVRQPLTVHGKRGREKVSFCYDPEKGEMNIEGVEQSPVQIPGGGVAVGNWYYVLEDGFYPMDSVGLPIFTGTQ